VKFDRTLQFIDQIERCPDALALERCLLDVGSEYGFNALFGGLVPNSHVSSKEIEERILFQHFPEEWAARYNDRGYVFRDPIVHRLQHDRNAFEWRDAYASCSSSEDVALIQGEASEFGLKVGFVIPVSTLDGGVTAVSFGGRHSDVGPEHRATLSFVATYAVGNFLHFRESRDRILERITAREFDCLLWSAEGKTDWEISVILGISKSTVAKHILSAREKLGAVNKGHAIGIALRTKLFR
jgi:LuxR family quorum sensing-dependent transcriptional regulator